MSNRCITCTKNTSECHYKHKAWSSVKGFYQIRVVKFDTVECNGNGNSISKDACIDQDDKSVPLKWGSGENAEVLGTANLEIRDDGLYATINEETYKKLLGRKIDD